MAEDPVNSGSPKVSDAPVYEARLRAAQVAQLYAQTRLRMCAAVVASTALIAMLWSAVEHWRLLAWLGVFLAVQAGRHALASAFRRSSRVKLDPAPWGTWFTVGSALSSLLWGLATIFIFPAGSFFHEFLLASFLVGVAAATAVVTAPITQCYVSSIVLLAMPAVGRFMYEGGELHFSMGVVGLLYTAALLAIGRSVHSMTSDSTRLQIDKDDLIGSLQQARGHLEFRVSERTADLARKNKELEIEISYRKLAEADLRESEQRYRELAEMLPEMVYEVDQHGCVTFVNNCGCDLTGYSVEDLESGFEAIRLIAPEDRERVQEHISEALARGASGLNEYRAQRKNGETFPVLARLTPILWEGKYVGLRGLMIDITERKKADEALQESEKRYRVVVEQTGQLIYDYDVRTGSIKWAGAVEQLTGYTLEEFQEVDIAGWEDRIHPEDRARALALLDEAVRTRALYDVAYRFRRSDGTYVDMEDTGAFLFNESGVAYRMLGSMKDVTDRKRAESALRQSEERFRTIFEGAQDGIFVVDPRTRKAVLVNGSMCKLTGYGRDELLRLSVDEIYPQDQLPQVLSQFRELIEGKISMAAETPVRRKDGETVYCDISTGFSRSGERDLFFGFFRDVTERRLMEQALRESEESYRRLVELAPYGVGITRDGNAVFVNRCMANLLGAADPGEIIDRSMLDFVLPEYRDVVTRLLREVPADSRPVPAAEIRFVRLDGQVGELEVTAIPFTYQKRPAVQAVCIDITERKKAYMALRESEERYRTLVELMNEGLAVENEDGMQFYVNDKFAEMLGYHKEELVRRPCWHFVDPDSRVKAQTESSQRKHGRSSVYEIVLRRKDGRPVNVIVSASPFIDGQGIFRGAVAVFTDITERKQAEEAIRESEERYRTLFEYSRDAINIVTRDGWFIDANKAFLSLFGYSKEEVHGMNARQMWADPAKRSQWQEKLELEGSVIDYDWKAVRKDGSVRDCLLTSTVRRFEDGRMQYQSICRDITEQKLAETALRESEQMFRLLSEQSLMAVAILQDGVYKYVNQTTAAMLEYSAEQITSWKPEEFIRVVHPEDKPLVLRQARLKQRGDAGQTPNYTFRICTKSGKVKWLEILSKTVQFKGRPANLLTMLDITDRKLAAEQLRQAARMEAIGQLAGGIAHDFNNLLTGILGYSDMLMQQWPRGNPSKEKLFQIGRAARRATALTQQLLAFGRKQVLEMKAMDLNVVISDIEEMLRRLIGENIEIVTDLDPSVGMVYADPGQIEQILMNLAVNARDAMPNGGSLRIETANAVLDQQYAQANPEAVPGDYVMFAVTDSGIGMDSHTRSRIFEPFFTTKEKGVGTGLGLATVYGIVKQHRGHLTAYSEPGIGTTFRIYLPRVEEICDQNPSVTLTRVRPHGTETILVVEDEEVVRNLACEAMEMLGYTPLKASDPEEALAVAQNHQGTIHLLLTDVVLPQMDGRSLYNRLSVSRPEMRVLFVSGYTENFIVHHGVLDPSVHFLQKPFTVDSLGNKVRQVLDAERDS